MCLYSGVLTRSLSPDILLITIIGYSNGILTVFQRCHIPPLKPCLPMVLDKPLCYKTRRIMGWMTV